ncbi:membrane primary amine oxidase [Microcaecilia unicolor]|uniref:Amine oxidase n=1 Tax=Microcaecilia unicolor TaxID=1415580 RepID=A0A6P7ZQA7_9AMPH|nr:membrane primary amine oxidase-like [Microcaecilia unicolor]
MNLKIVLVILVLLLAVIVVLTCLLLSGSGKGKSCGPPATSDQQAKHDDQSTVFSDLTPDEFSQVVSYLKNELGVDFVDAINANPSDNCIYSIDVQFPKKQKVLDYLDKGKPKPKREALAVVFFGNQPDPNITEYIVGPLPTPTYCKDITLEKYKANLPYHRRPVILKEYDQLHSFLNDGEFPKASRFMREILGYEKDEDFVGLTTAPRGSQSGDRNTWFVVFQNPPGAGFFLHPVGLEILVDHKSLNISQWKLQKVFYNGMYFNNMTHLENMYILGNLPVVKIKKVTPETNLASLRPPKASTTAIPLQYEPHGPRYSVKNNQVLFQSWRFAFGISVNTGLRLFDIRFKGERIVYELSLQDAISVYGSNAPGGMVTRYMDGSFGIGRFAFQMVKGIDCPYTATYVDTNHLMESEKSEKLKNSICIFEQNSGLPLRRHYSNFYSMYYGGLPNTVLVVRSISTLGNYDYVFDFIFYSNGAIESKVHATGYITSSFFFANGTEYGNRVGEYTLGTIHNHFINYKVDLDVGGTRNSVVGHDMTFETVEAPWNSKMKIQRPKLTKIILDNEKQTAFRLQAAMPRYIQFASDQKNKWGHERSYRIQIVSFAGDYLPESSAVENSMNWARYKLAITKRKDEEPQSSSAYNQNDPWTPSVQFSDFIDNESIKNEDLVAWITTGFLHIPHAEDIPNTVTAGNGVGFYLRPYNYFNEDPSIHSHDGVYFTTNQDSEKCEINQAACLSKTAACVPKIPPFTYDGFENMLIL